jgi:hypothetical protein
MQDKEVVGIGRVVLARRERPIMLEPRGKVIRAVTLHHAPEVRHAAVYFADTPDIKLPAEMKELAEVIIDRKTGHFLTRPNSGSLRELTQYRQRSARMNQITHRKIRQLHQWREEVKRTGDGRKSNFAFDFPSQSVPDRTTPISGASSTSSHPAQRFLSVHAATYNTFNIQRHLTSARTHRAFRASALETWREVVAVA